MHIDTAPSRTSGRRWVMLGLAAVGVAAAVAGAWWRLSGDGAIPIGSAPRDGGPLLALSLPDASGRDTPLAQWKGKLLIVNFWATWCTPCREEMPRFVDLQNRHGAKGLQFVGIAIDQPDKVQAFASEIGLNYPSLVGGYSAIELSKTLGNRLGALPFTVVVDRSGAIVHTQLGPVKDPQLQSMIDQLL